ncbi:MAG TPA: hypothetical protein VFW38_05710 [Solirubrobacteraceae bacterium]|nr:hypothetical protein [Solirubrobacteraceae bacterium]
MRCRLLSAATSTALLAAAVASASAANTLSNPTHNLSPSRATLFACLAPSGAQLSCEVHARADIARARRREGLAPLSLPRRFAKLSVAEQLLAIADDERVDRGLPPALGLTRRLDSAAHTAAVGEQDPLGPAGYSWGSNWAGGSHSALFADFVWMYDDGPGAENGDCLKPGEPGCWGHRENVLARLPVPIAMGAGVRGKSLTELFVGGYRPAMPGGADPLLSPSWAQLSA